MLNITLRQMRALVAVHEESKIVSAAARLGVTAPAVTLQLKDVEAEVGLQLFDRTSQGMRLTPAGEVFIAAARTILSRIDDLQAELDAVRGARGGRLKVGVVSLAQYVAPQLLAAFAGEFPAIAVELVIGSRAETMNRLKIHDVDIVITARPPKGISVRAEAFAEYRLAMVAAPGNALAGRKGISKSDLASEHFVIRERGSGPRQSIDAFMTEGRKRLAFHYTEMASNEAIKRAVLADLGIAFVATHGVATELKDGHIVMLDVDGLPLFRQWFAISRTDRSLSPAMARFLAFLMQNGSRFLQPDDVFYGFD